MSEATNPLDNPTLAALVAAAERRYTADSDEPGARAVVDGTGSVVDVQVLDPSLPPGVVGERLVGALSRALSSAREGSFAEIKAAPGLPGSTRELLEGGQAPEDVGTAGDAAAVRTFTGTAGQAQVSFDNRTQQFTQVYVPALDDESLADVVRAANRALTLAATGGEQAEPLIEQIDQRLAQLDARLGELSARLDDSLARLDGLL